MTEAIDLTCRGEAGAHAGSLSLCYPYHAITVYPRMTNAIPNCPTVVMLLP